jgi:hypothetical protein
MTTTECAGALKVYYGHILIIDELGSWYVMGLNAVAHSMITSTGGSMYLCSLHVVAIYNEPAYLLSP